MRNDETLIKQAELLTALASAGDDLKSALKVQSPQMASLAVKRLFATVDAFRATIPDPVYEPAVGDVVWVMGTVAELETRYGGVNAKVFTGKGAYDYVAVNPDETPMRLDKKVEDVQ